MDLVQRLEEMVLFDVMSAEDRTRWASRFKRVYYHRGDVVVRQGDRATAFFIIDQGELRAYIGADSERRPVAYFYEGDYFGETALLSGARRNATVEVLTAAELFVLEKADFDQLMEEFPTIRQRLYTLGREREEAGRMQFPWQRPDEVILFFSTKHWIALLRKLRFTFVLGILGFVFTVAYLGAVISALPAGVLIVLAGTTLAFTVLLAMYHYFDWRNDYYIITSLRVLHVERVLLLREDRDEAPVERVQDVQVRQEGFLANVLGFGRVIIQTAAATENVIFADVPEPRRVRDALFAPLYHAKTRERAEVHDAIRQELGQRLQIPTTSSEEQEETTDRKETGAPAGKETQEAASEASALIGWLLGIWQGFLGLFSFETWILSDEGVTITWRKTGWLLFRVSIVPVFAGLFVATLFLLSVSQGVGLPVVPLFLLLLLLAIFIWWFYLYWDWQNDIYQISGDRLIDLKKRPLFLEELRRETTLDRIQNISLSIPGPIAQVLQYGTVIIETAGEMGAFQFEYVHRPRDVQNEIFSRWEQFRRRQQEAERRRRQAEMGEWFEIYDDMMRQNQG